MGRKQPQGTLLFGPASTTLTNAHTVSKCAVFDWFRSRRILISLSKPLLKFDYCMYPTMQIQAAMQFMQQMQNVTNMNALDSFK